MSMRHEQPPATGQLSAVKQSASPERMFWVEIRRGLLILLKAVESRIGTDPSSSANGPA